MLSRSRFFFLLRPRGSSESTYFRFLCLVQTKTTFFLSLKQKGTHFNDSLMQNKAFRNPTIYKKLVDHVGVDERAGRYGSVWEWGKETDDGEWGVERICESRPRRLIALSRDSGLGQNPLSGVSTRSKIVPRGLRVRTDLEPASNPLLVLIPQPTSKSPAPPPPRTPLHPQALAPPSPSPPRRHPRRHTTLPSASPPILSSLTPTLVRISRPRSETRSPLVPLPQRPQGLQGVSSAAGRSMDLWVCREASRRRSRRRRLGRGRGIEIGTGSMEVGRRGRLVGGDEMYAISDSRTTERRRDG